MHAAYIASTIANYSGKLRVAKKPDDFMFVHPDTRRQRETKKTLLMMDALAKKHV